MSTTNVAEPLQERFNSLLEDWKFEPDTCRMSLRSRWCPPTNR